MLLSFTLYYMSYTLYASRTEEGGLNLVSAQGWSALARKGSYSMLLPAGLLLRKEYLQVFIVSLHALLKLINAICVVSRIPCQWSPQRGLPLHRPR